MTVQAMLDIASRYITPMADAMIAACVEWSVRHNIPLVIPRREENVRRAEKRPTEDFEFEEWRRMAEGNSDTRWNHV